MTRVGHRLDRLPSYAVGELAAIKRRLIADGVDVIDLAAGDADLPPPATAVRALETALTDPAMSRYAYQIGLAEFREAVVSYMERRFGVRLDPTKEVLPLIGSKEGLAHLPAAVMNPGEVCVLPDPGYPAYVGGAVLADGEIEYVPLTAEKDFLLELGELPTERLNVVRLVFLNYPNNPTTAVAPLEYLQRTVAVCRRRDIVIAYDNPYCELTFDGYRAPSILEIEGAREVAVEFHSLSKSFCMTGWRLGWAVGNSAVIAALNKIKSYVDTGAFLAVQKAGAAVLNDAEALVAPVRKRFVERRDQAVRALNAAGLPLDPPKATIYLWVRLPEGVSAEAFARDALEQEGVMVLPGSVFGTIEGYFRIALTVDGGRLTDAATRLGRSLERVGVARARS